MSNEPIFKGKTTVAEVARQHDLTVSEVGGWIEEAHLQIYALKSFAACSTRTRTRNVAAGETGPGGALRENA